MAAKYKCPEELSADLAKLRETVRKFLRAIECVPMRAVDCDQDEVDRLESKLVKLSGYRRSK